MIDHNRYFEKTATGQVILVAYGVSEDGLLSYVLNTHMLSDPEDLTSAPLAGWTSIGEARFNERLAEQEVEIADMAEADRIAEAVAREAAYDEAVALGFSPSAASAMSGHTPA